MLEYSLGVMNERKPGHPENEPAGNCRELRVDILNHQNSELTSCRYIVTVAAVFEMNTLTTPIQHVCNLCSHMSVLYIVIHIYVYRHVWMDYGVHAMWLRLCSHVSLHLEFELKIDMLRSGKHLL